MTSRYLPYDNSGRLVLRRLLGRSPFGYVVLNFDPEYDLTMSHSGESPSARVW
jgi:hypothetical protein